MKRSAAQDQKVTQDNEGDLEPERDQVPQGDTGQRDLLVNIILGDPGAASWDNGIFIG